jgi:hypothetical protein
VDMTYQKFSWFYKLEMSWRNIKAANFIS